MFFFFLSPCQIARTYHASGFLVMLKFLNWDSFFCMEYYYISLRGKEIYWSWLWNWIISDCIFLGYIQKCWMKAFYKGQALYQEKQLEREDDNALCRKRGVRIWLYFILHFYVPSVYCTFCNLICVLLSSVCII